MPSILGKEAHPPVARRLTHKKNKRVLNILFIINQNSRVGMLTGSFFQFYGWEPDKVNGVKNAFVAVAECIFP
jgi:hypothetical protein